MTDSPTHSEVLEVAVRAHAVPHTQAPATGKDPDSAAPKQRTKRTSRPVEHVVVFDCETTTDPTQRLLYGAWRYYILNPKDPTEHTVAGEGLFYGDDLPQRDPAGFAALGGYVNSHDAATGPGRNRRLGLMSRAEFVEWALWRIGHQNDGVIVGFNLPFDLSRLAVRCGPTRGRNRGGFSMQLWEHEGGNHQFRPRVILRSIDANRCLISFSSTSDPQAGNNRGRFVDTRTLAYAHTDRTGLSLEAACAAFAIPFTKTNVEHRTITPEHIDYCRADVAATAELYQALTAEHARHPIDLPPQQTFSPAGPGRSYLQAIGIPPVAERPYAIPDDVNAMAMEAFYGGRAECRIRKVICPVVYADFRSMYMTCNALMNTWTHLTANHVEVRDTTTQVRDLLTSEDLLERCLDPDMWPTLHTLVHVDPNGARLPVRARYRPGGDEWAIGVNPLTSDRPFWYSLADVIAATLLPGPDPIIHQAWQLAPHGTLADLKSVNLAGEVPFNPRTDDLYRALVEQRRRCRTDLARDPEERERLNQFFKVMANSTGYGIHCQFNRQHVPEPVPVTVWPTDGPPYDTTTRHPEAPGPYCQPTLAATVTSAARLMLALLETLVTDRGGSWVFCDTDSMAIVATPTGNPPNELPDNIQPLSWGQVDSIIDRFRALSSYNPDIVPGSILELETENLDQHGAQQQLWCHAISTKRYQLTADNNEVVKTSQHGLGNLTNPTNRSTQDWIQECWAWMTGQIPDPDWLDTPAITRTTLASPEHLNWFRHLNTHKSYPDQVKPFNFVHTCYPDPLDPATTRGCQPIAPYTSDPDNWGDLQWIDRTTAHPVTLYSGPPDGHHRPGTVRVLTYRDKLDRYRTHPEHKTLDPDGQIPTPDTVGVLVPRPITAVTPLLLIGKEANDLHRRAIGDGDHTNLYNPTNQEWHQLITPALRCLPTSQIAPETGIGRRTVERARAGHSVPHSDTRETLTKYITDYARKIAGAGRTPNTSTLLRRHLHHFTERKGQQ